MSEKILGKIVFHRQINITQFPNKSEQDQKEIVNSIYVHSDAILNRFIDH